MDIPTTTSFLIVFDGIDGVGKTTQLELAQQALSDSGHHIATFRSLGSTPIGEELRQVMLMPLPRPPQTDLYIATAIQESLIIAVNEERAKGSISLMDRGPLSLGAYQIYGSGLSLEIGWPYVENGMKRLKPDLYIIYQADIAESLKRAKSASKEPDYFENKPLSYFEKVEHGFRESAKHFDNVITIDGNGDIQSIHAQTMAAIKSKLKLA